MAFDDRAYVLPDDQCPLLQRFNERGIVVSLAVG